VGRNGISKITITILRGFLACPAPYVMPKYAQKLWSSTRFFMGSYSRERLNCEMDCERYVTQQSLKTNS